MSQIYDRCSTSIPFVDEQIVDHDSVASDRKFVGLARSTARHEYFRGAYLVTSNIRSPIGGDYDYPRFRTTNVNDVLTRALKGILFEMHGASIAAGKQKAPDQRGPSQGGVPDRL
jgi:hypothetical protein